MPHVCAKHVAGPLTFCPRQYAQLVPQVRTRTRARHGDAVDQLEAPSIDPLIRIVEVVLHDGRRAKGKRQAAE